MRARIDNEKNHSPRAYHARVYALKYFRVPSSIPRRAATLDFRFVDRMSQKRPPWTAVELKLARWYMVFEGFAPAEQSGTVEGLTLDPAAGASREGKRVAQRERERDKNGGRKRERERESGRTRVSGSRLVEERRARWGGGAGSPYETFHAYAWYVHTYMYI